MTGLLETIMRDRHGEPVVVATEAFVEYRWNVHVEAESSTLYKRREPQGNSAHRFASLQTLYGDAIGGFLIGGSLKVAMLDGPKVFGLYGIEELQAHPRVQYANSVDPGICFFMDAANVWYYGLKHGQLFVYDAQFEELDCLGDVRPQLEALMEQWEEAGRA